ncbi:hypothetical protein ACFQYP_01340 [Nonomuraea antimicrobica]
MSTAISPPPLPVDELAGRLLAGERIHLLDVRWQLGDPDGRRKYLDGHLPGARYVDLDRELAARPSRPRAVTRSRTPPTYRTRRAAGACASASRS